VADCISSKIHQPKSGSNTTAADKKFERIQRMMKEQNLDKLGNCGLDDWKTMETTKDELKV
jgi:hypothetical protein